MRDISLPENVRRLGAKERFRFSCHPGVPCFTDCCRQLDLALTPYDVLRLRRSLGVSCSEFLERYVLVEKTDEDIFPQVFLAMVDDGRASCPFVSADGCSVYADRPGACRTYPIGRGAYLDDEGRPADFHVLLTEPHCRGFAEGPELTVGDWIADQELAVYNEINDLVMTILHHQRIKEGFRPNEEQQQRYLNVLYNPEGSVCLPKNRPNDDEELLKLAIRLLNDELPGW
ncbi:MAG: YkgJ family cysteine cluster protein [Thermodesulfobacteriota bacterium]